MNRWQLGNYTMQINPNQNTLTANSQNQSVQTVNGLNTNPNLYYTKQMQFKIDVYEDRTSVNTTPIASFSPNKYLSVSEDRVLEQFYLLNNSGGCDVLRTDGSEVRSFTVTSGNSVTLPSTYPKYVCATDSNLYFLYLPSAGSQLIVTDENGVASSKYTYSNLFTSLCWDYNNNLYTLDSYGRIYSINTSNGASTLFIQFDDYVDNTNNYIKPYTSLMMCDKQGFMYLAVLKNSNTLIYVRLSDGKVVNNIGTTRNNVIDLAYSNYSFKSYILMSNGLYQITTNTARLDVDIIKEQISNGQVTVLDEHSIPTVIYCSNTQVDRLRNMNESRYEIQFSAYVAYMNKGYSNTWGNIIST